ncbi:MAG TPA: leucine--tRNA ligase [Actinomycetota bacterium]|nr:leucine--tRNA ligase [Actinomycetota bacterium]
MERSYDFAEIEQRLAARWTEENPWRAPRLPRDPANKRYLLTMFPYPSGDMHMGHVEVFSIHDAIARYARMRGFDVLSPLGFDAFGLPAENAAIKRGIHPKKWTYSNIEKLLSSAQRLGCSFDWSRIFRTCDPEYYRWNQWFFLKMYERGLAYRKEAPAWWCPNDKTVLANEQVVNGLCERCDTPVEKRWLTQWFFKISDYADRLLDDMDVNVGWSDRLKMLQRNWIGRSTGAEIDFTIEGSSERITVYTTRPDTLWGATFFVLAPEHPLVERIVDEDVRHRFVPFKQDVERMTEIDRTSTERPKKGMFLGRYVVNPVNGERIPIWTADYVLMDYGTGAIMAVPAHDQRDFEFARQHDLEVRVVIAPEGAEPDGALLSEAYAGDGVMVNSGPFDGTPAEDAVRKVTDWLESQGIGRYATNYRLRDWLISRQRYWGTPIPIVYCEEHGEVPVPEADLPVVLPEDVDFTPTGEASPLATAESWVQTVCPICGAPARRETDTMDTFVDSSWYFHRYLDPENDAAPFDPDVSNAWMPIDQYTGGIEHAVMHLIYARFFQKVLVEMGMARDPEPFPALLNQGTVTMGGKRMSKSRGNLVDPQEAFERYGADALRLYMLFSGPPWADFDWPEEGVTAIGRVTAPWLARVWRLCDEVRDLPPSSTTGDAEASLRKRMHQTIGRVTADYDEFSFNTAIARLMELVNDTYRYRAAGGSDGALLREVSESLLKMLAPMAPFMTEELWAISGNEGSIHSSAWPTFDPDLARDEEVMMVVQVNGKVRDTIPVPVTIDQEGMLERAMSSTKVRSHLDGKEIAKVVAKPPKLLSLVVPR